MVRSPTSVRIFKTKKFISDKNTDLKYYLQKFSRSNRLKHVLHLLKKMFLTVSKNLEENAHNWMYRVNADNGFLIDD